jgi:glutaredoxin-related protein
MTTDTTTAQRSLQVDMAGEIHSSSSDYSGDAAPLGDRSSQEAPYTPGSLKKKDSNEASSEMIARMKETRDDVEAPILKARAIPVTDLGAYGGETLPEKIESLINEHPVVMFNRSWCLFSVDAMNFLVEQHNVSVHSLEIDTHPQGREILNYITKKTKHKTTPAIFIRGDFLGGFEEVNSMYATCALQRDYLAELSQADKCEDFINKTNLTKKPLFWFPETVNAYAIQISGVLTCLASIAAAVLVYWFSWGTYLAYGLAADFFMRILAGSILSPIGRIACLLARSIGHKPRVGRPKQFASLCGFTFSFLGSICYALPLRGFTLAGSVILGMLAVATGMEGFLDYCVGCTIFKWGVKLGIIST